VKFSVDPSIEKVPFYPKAALYGAEFLAILAR